MRKSIEELRDTLVGIITETKYEEAAAKALLSTGSKLATIRFAHYSGATTAYENVLETVSAILDTEPEVQTEPLLGTPVRYDQYGRIFDASERMIASVIQGINGNHITTCINEHESLANELRETKAKLATARKLLDERYGISLDIILSWLSRRSKGQASWTTGRWVDE